VPKPGEERKRPAIGPTLAPFSDWMARNARVARDYEPLNPERLATITLGLNFTPVALPEELGHDPAGLRRNADKVVFYAFKKGIYLPLGYRPLDSQMIVDHWPKVLVRESDNVKFVRITGARYTRGDFRIGRPAPDLKGNECTPHEVEVSGFYIQETEVTNKEINHFQKSHLDVPLKAWKDGLVFLIDAKKSQEEVMRYPAWLINRATAQKYAQSVLGRLPTEAEWEFAARSRGLHNLWASRSALVKKEILKAHLETNPANPHLYPVPVKTYEEDQTDQGVFDMIGNVSEWCLDVYRPYSEIIKLGPTLVNPRVGGEPEADNPQLEYVVRGGSFQSNRQDAMVFQRNGVSSDQELQYLGFRVVLECPPEGEETPE
jgi:serine/threonine-protein kinase